MCFSVDSVPNEQLTLGRMWMDDSNKENSPEPAQPKHFGPTKSESVLSKGPPNSNASLTTTAQCSFALVFTTSGMFVRTIGRPGSGPGELCDAHGLVVDTDGFLMFVLMERNVYKYFKLFFFLPFLCNSRQMDWFCLL